MTDKLSLENEKGLVKFLSDLDPKIWVLDPSEYAKSIDLKGKYPLSEFSFVVDYPLKVMNTRKWCDFMWRRIEGDSVQVISGKVTNLSYNGNHITGVEIE